MARHTSNRHNKKSNVAKWLPAAQEPTSGYRTLFYWVTVMVGLLSLGLLWQRLRGAKPVNAAALSFTPLRLPHDNGQRSYDIQFPGLAPLLLSSAVTYQTGNSVVGVLSSLPLWPLWFAIPVAGQSPGVNIVVPEFRVNSNTTAEQSHPEMASTSTGEWMLVWRGLQTGDYDIYAQRYAANGSALGSEFRVNSNTTSTQQNPAVASTSAGEWVVVWEGYQTGNADIYAQRYALNGSVLGSEFRVNNVTADQQRRHAVASTSAGEWVVVWEGYQTSDSDIYAQRYASSGSVIGSEFRVNSNRTGLQGSPVVASTDTGEWMVVWDDYRTNKADIYAQRYAVNGSVLGSEFRVNSNTTGNQYIPALTSTTSGEWVVVWWGDQVGERDIYAQRYAMNGSVLGSEFLVNSITKGAQGSPAVASTSTGEWMVVWDSSYQSGNLDIYAQRYGLNGSVLGSEFRVNNNTKGTQQNPSVVSTRTGEWVVVWEGEQTGNYDIYGSIFSSTAMLSSTSMLLQLTTTNGNSVKTSEITTPLVTFVSSPSSGTTAAVSVTTNQSIAPNTPQQATTTDANSSARGTVIGAAAGVGGFGIAICLGAIGFYAYRKRARARQGSSSVVNGDVGTTLKTTDNYPKMPIHTSQLPSEYVQIDIMHGNPSDNAFPVNNSPYAHIDEMKKSENEYDHAPTF